MFPQVDAKLIDFGLSKFLSGAFIYTDYIVGTLGYHAPEMFDGFYWQRSDIFLLGVTFAVMVGRI